MIHEKIYLKQSIISQLRNYHVSKQLGVVHDSVIGWLLVNYKNMNLYTNPSSQVAEKLQPSQAYYTVKSQTDWAAIKFANICMIASI